MGSWNFLLPINIFCAVLFHLVLLLLPWRAYVYYTTSTPAIAVQTIDWLVQTSATQTWICFGLRRNWNIIFGWQKVIILFNSLRFVRETFALTSVMPLLLLASISIHVMTFHISVCIMTAVDMFIGTWYACIYEDISLSWSIWKNNRDESSFSSEEKEMKVFRVARVPRIATSKAMWGMKGQYYL